MEHNTEDSSDNIVLDESLAITTADTISSTRKTRKLITKALVQSFLLLVDSGTYTMQGIGRALDLAPSTISRLYKRYLNGELLNLRNFKSSTDKKKETKKEFNNEKNIVASELALNPCTTLSVLARKLHESSIDGSNYSVSTVCRIVKSMDYTRKALTLVPINRNSNQNKALRNEYARFISDIRDEQFVFIDESGFNLHLSRRFGYSQKNTKAYIGVPNSKGVNVSLICAIDINGIVAYKIKTGSFKSLDFVSFIETELPIVPQNERKCIVMDNASIHKTATVITALRNKGYSVKFLPPYTPQLNPIEEFFSSLKSRFHRRERSSNNAMLIETLEDVLRTENFDMRGFFTHMRTWIPRALTNEDFI